MDMQSVLDALNENRLLVFLECREDPDCESEDKHHFHQVILTPQQFKKVSDATILSEIGDDALRPGYKLATMKMSDQIFDYKTFEGLSSHA